MDESGCAFGAVVLAVLLGGLYGVYMLFSAYTMTFSLLAGGLAILVTILTIRASRKRKALKEQKEAEQLVQDVEYAESPEGKIDAAIERCKAQKQEQIEQQSELDSLIKYNLDKIYIRQNLPQQGKELLMHYKGRQSSKNEQENFKELYGQTIENEIKQRQIDQPDAESFTIRNEVNRKYNELYFKPSYYYQEDIKPNMLHETLLEVEGVIQDLKGQQEVAEAIVTYYDKVERQFRQTRENYKATKGLSDTKDSLERISASSIMASENLKSAKEEAAYEKTVFEELQKLTLDFEDGLSSTLQGMVKADLNKINADFKKDLNA